MSGRRSKEDTCFWNEEVEEAVPRKKDEHIVLFQNSTEESKRRYEGLTNKAREAVLKAMRETDEEMLAE